MSSSTARSMPADIRTRPPPGNKISIIFAFTVTGTNAGLSAERVSPSTAACLEVLLLQDLQPIHKRGSTDILLPAKHVDRQPTRFESLQPLLPLQNSSRPLSGRPIHVASNRVIDPTTPDYTTRQVWMERTLTSWLRRLRSFDFTYAGNCILPSTAGRRAEAGKEQLRSGDTTPTGWGYTCLGLCLIRVPFSWVSGTLIERRQSGTRRPGLTAGNGRGRFCTGNGTFSDMAGANRQFAVACW